MGMAGWVHAAHAAAQVIAQLRLGIGYAIQRGAHLDRCPLRVRHIERDVPQGKPDSFGFLSHCYSRGRTSVDP